MIVCLCNGFNCRAVGGQIAAGASSVASVFRGLGCQPQCGTCVHNIREMILLHHGPRDHGHGHGHAPSPRSANEPLSPTLAAE